MVAAAPTLMDDDYTVELWLRNDAHDDTGTNADATQAAYRDAKAQADALAGEALGPLAGGGGGGGMPGQLGF